MPLFLVMDTRQAGKEDSMTTRELAEPTSLDDLLALMRDGADGVMDPRSPTEWRTDLPTFGGEEIENTHAVWSWDAGRVLYGHSGDDLRIITRAEYAEMLA